MRKLHSSVGLFLLFLLMTPFISSAEYGNSTPSQACSFMSAMGMATRGYKNPDNMGYFCSSPYKELGTGFPLANNMAYYAEGNAQKVTKLKLVLNVNSKHEAKQAHIEWANSAEALLKKAMNVGPLALITTDPLLLKKIDPVETTAAESNSSPEG